MYWLFFAVILLVLSILEFYLPQLRRVLFLVSIIIVFLSISGNYYNGLDWINYSEVYKYQLTKGPELIFSGFFEPFFMVLIYLISLCSNNYQALVVAVGLIFSVVVFYSIRTATLPIPYPVSFLFLLYCFCAYYLFGEALRQNIASSIIWLGLLRINKISHRKWFIYCFIAVGFHVTAIVMLPIKWILSKQFSKKALILVASFFIIIIYLLINLHDLLPYLRFLPFFIYKKLQIYFADSATFRFGFFAILDLLAIVLLFYFRYQDFKTKDTIIVWNGTLLFFILHLCFYAAPFFQRILYYLFPLVSLYATLQLSTIGLLNIRKFYYFIVVIYVSAALYSPILLPYYAYYWAKPQFYYIDYLNSYDEDDFISHLRKTKCNLLKKDNPNFCM